MKSTAIACAKIAFIKYWGKRDEILRLPLNSSVSMNLDSLYSETTVEFSDDLGGDELTVDGVRLGEDPGRISAHLDRVRALAGINTRARVASRNNFPVATGLASSASGFAALTVAAADAAGLKLSEKELSILARQGSGSACRSVPAGFVEWVKGDSGATSFATSLFGPEYWNIVDVIAIVSREAKETGSTGGQKIAATSPFLPARLQNIGEKINNIKEYIAAKNFPAFGKLMEAEAMELHAIAMTSSPSLVYWRPKTVELIKKIWELRNQGLEVYFTIDAGPNVHIIIEDKNLGALMSEFRERGDVTTIIARPGSGAKLAEQHLF
jgi:diphosphomevalonate decarboxylase